MLTCFVAMGFGEKTAFYLGKKKQRTLDLDKTYEHIIKPAAVRRWARLRELAGVGS